MAQGTTSKMRKVRATGLLALAAAVETAACAGRRDAPHCSSRWRFPVGRRTPPPHLRDGKMTMANVTCHFFEQPLDHFSSSSLAGTFRQRYCVYDGYDTPSPTTKMSASDDNPIFFYTGNESPLDEYVNNTGLMWELAPKHSALIVFAEHRYEGPSTPDFTFWNDPRRRTFDGCMTYLTSSQALADFASLLSFLNPDHARPVITFGGSYGGMLSAWMRMKYPGTVAGAVAASAPIWGFPLTQERRDGTRWDDASGIAGAHRVVGRGVTLPYPPASDSEEKEEEGNYCFHNLLASWPLMTYYGRTESGRALLADVFKLCTPLRSTDDVAVLLEWAQSPWFDLAEGDFPFPSSYIPYALNMGNNDLPPWPVQKACHDSGLRNDWGVRYGHKVGDSNETQPVRYKITFNKNSSTPSKPLVLDIDWDEMTVLHDNQGGLVTEELLAATREAISVWFNVSGNVTCYDAVPAINMGQRSESPDIAKGPQDEIMLSESPSTARELKNRAQNLRETSRTVDRSYQPSSPARMCAEKIENETVWTSLVCNEDMNMVITLGRGMGDDFFWPPSHPRGTETYADIVASSDDPNHMAEVCSDPGHVYGFPPAERSDPWSTWLDDYYGGTRIESYSNIVFSNGLLDPWAAAGVYAHGMNPTARSNLGSIERFERRDNYDGPLVQNVTADGSVVAVILKSGAHHLDLMYSSEHDPQCAVEARNVEDKHIDSWVREWHNKR